MCLILMLIKGIRLKPQNKEIFCLSKEEMQFPQIALPVHHVYPAYSCKSLVIHTRVFNLQLRLDF